MKPPVLSAESRRQITRRYQTRFRNRLEREAETTPSPTKPSLRSRSWAQQRRVWSSLERQTLGSRILAKNRYCLSQALPLKSFQILCHCLGRVLEALAVILCRGHHSARCKVQQMKDEFVRVLRFNPQRSDGVSRKVAQVHRND